MKELNPWTVTTTESASLMRSDSAAPDQRLQLAEAEVCRLTRCVEMKDRQLCELRKALAHSATVHYSFESRLQRELDALRVMMPVNGFGERSDRPAGERTEWVVVKLPYMTSILSVLFDAMCTFWTDCDLHRLPKSATVARAIDERLGLSAQQNGEASRSGQAYASAIRPDWVKEADNRHRYRPSVVR
ncbi:hypothetical protein [Paraburkholderia silvatlantica]|uniref:Uncharacterized protein n=1 Tax=Paraburkholderia silvatlantica TaxID=321895 RepID=A0A2V4T6Q1_9BURK|nr:hypothetical protein [Paraburkholderia silvatlantica]PYE21225.1 hypothetical protein C7410_11568 [Paraburkholderia silvatlantica]TDQ86634.1 hypothetical protein C7412_117129 [Paraburkholderia silvatlantica]